jgi:hypothetical protein
MNENNQLLLMYKYLIIIRNFTELRHYYYSSYRKPEESVLIPIHYFFMNYFNTSLSALAFHVLFSLHVLSPQKISMHF